MFCPDLDDGSPRTQNPHKIFHPTRTTQINSLFTTRLLVSTRSLHTRITALLPSYQPGLRTAAVREEGRTRRYCDLRHQRQPHASETGPREDVDYVSDGRCQGPQRREDRRAAERRDGRF